MLFVEKTISTKNTSVEGQALNGENFKGIKLEKTLPGIAKYFQT